MHEPDLVRSLEPDAINRWPTGTRVGVSIAGSDAMAFEAELGRLRAWQRKEEKLDAGP